MPVVVSVWPCALLIVRAKAGRNGNWRRVNLIGEAPLSFVVSGTRGMRTMLSENDIVGERSS